MKRLFFVLFLSTLLFAAGKEFTQGKLIDISSDKESKGAMVVGNVAAAIDWETFHISVQKDNLVYVGDYLAKRKGSYRPGDLIVNDPIAFRIDGDKLILKRPNGEELKTKLVKTTRLESKS
jgi:hypothetical protein